MRFLKNNVLTFIGLIIGAVSGYLYYYYIGCAGGSCMITSQPVNSTLYGAVMGSLLWSTFKKKPSKENHD